MTRRCITTKCATSGSVCARRMVANLQLRDLLTRESLCGAERRG
jgi:hypothetical protein